MWQVDLLELGVYIDMVVDQVVGKVVGKDFGDFADIEFADRCYGFECCPLAKSRPHNFFGLHWSDCL